MYKLIVLIFILISCNGKNYYSPYKLFWPNFDSMIATEMINIKTKQIYYFKDKNEAPKIIVNKNATMDNCKFLLGNILLGEFVPVVNSVNSKNHNFNDDIFINLYEDNLLKYCFRMKIIADLKKVPIKWEVSNLMNVPYNISNDTLSYKYEYIVPRF